MQLLCIGGPWAHQRVEAQGDRVDAPIPQPASVLSGSGIVTMTKPLACRYRRQRFGWGEFSTELYVAEDIKDGDVFEYLLTSYARRHIP